MMNVPVELTDNSTVFAVLGKIISIKISNQIQAKIKLKIKVTAFHVISNQNHN